MTRRLFRPAAWALACAACVATATPALAQRADGPYAGLFGTAPSPDLAQALNATGQLYGEYDRNTVPFAQTPGDRRLTDNGGGGGATGALNYQLVADRVRFGVGGSAASRAYPGTGASLAGMYSGTSSLSVNVTPKLVVDAGGSAGYSPFYNFAPFAGDSLGSGVGVAPGFGYAALAERNLDLQGSAGITSNFSKRSSLSVRVTGSEIKMLDDPADTIRTAWAQADFRHKLTRALSLHLGYGRQFADYALGSGASYRNDMISAGVDYGDSFSFSRRTALSFSASTMELRVAGDSMWRVNGSAQLTRGFGRSWATWISYVRDAGFDPAFRGPLLNDSANAGFGGQLALRAKWSTSLGYTRGTVGFQTGSFTAYGATSRLDLALTRVLGLYGQYSFYRYDVPPGLSTLPLVSRFTRGSVMAGLSVWVPIVNEVKPPKEPKDR